MAGSSKRRRAGRSESIQLGESDARPQKQQVRDLTSPPTPIEPVKPTPAIITIDLGMTSTRVVLAPRTVPYWQRPASISIVPRPREFSSMMTIPHQVKDGEFPNVALVFANGLAADDCLVFVAPGDTIGVPVKAFFYAQYLVKYHDYTMYTEIKEGTEKKIGEAKIKIRSILREIPQLEPFYEKYLKFDPDDQKIIMLNFRNILKAHLQLIYKHSEDAARRLKLDVKRMVVTTPSNWDHSMEHDYVAILEEVWQEKFKGRFIDVISEVDGWAHWFASRQLENWFDGMCHPFMIVDWGGHTMACYDFNIYGNKETREISFFKSEKYTCHHGGPEHYESLLRTNLRERIARECPKLSVKQRASMLESGLDHYRRHLRDKANPGAFTIKASKDMESPDQVFHFTEREGKDLYDRAYGRLIIAFAERLKNLRNAPRYTSVILFGGTFLIEGIRREFERLINRKGFSYNQVGQSDIPPDQRPYCVARGSAYAKQSEVSVEKAISQTSFAINIRDDNGRIPIIMRGGESASARVKVVREDEEGEVDSKDADYGKKMVKVEISGTPRAVAADKASLNVQKTYCLRSLLFFEEEYKVNSEFAKDDRHYSQGMLIISINPVRRLGGRRKAKRYDKTVSLPIYFDIGQGLVKVDIDRLNENPEGQPREDSRVLRSASSRSRRELILGNWTDGLDQELRNTVVGQDALRIFRENTGELEEIDPTRPPPDELYTDSESPLPVREEDYSSSENMSDLEATDDWQDAARQYQMISDSPESSNDSQSSRPPSVPTSQMERPAALRSPTGSQATPKNGRTPKNSDLPYRQAGLSSGLQRFVPRNLNIFRSTETDE